jgi:O-antigen/teichoic acid export membrane protein
VGAGPIIMAAEASKAGRWRGGLARRRAEGGSEGRGDHQLFRTAHALMLNTVLSGALGFAFWILAARLYSTERVGVNSALIAVMVTVSTLSQVNIASVFTRFLPESTRPAGFILLGYGIAGALSLVVATMVALIAPRVAQGLSVLGSNHLVTVIWIIAVGLWSIFALQDAALSALRFAGWVPVENTAFGIFKIVALVALAAAGAAQGMLIAWVLPMAILVLPVNLIIFRKAVTAHHPAHDEGIVSRFGRRRLYGYLGMTGLAAIVDQGVQAALPVVVVAILGATQNAYFYVAFTIVFSFEILGDNICTALTIEGSFAEHRLRELTIAAARRLALILLPATLALIVAAPIVLLFFGRTYADHATTVLRLLAFGTLFRAGTWLYVAVCRVQGRGHVVLAISAAMSAGTLGFVIVFARLWGLEGVGLAGLAINVIVAAAIVPQLVRFIRRPVAPKNSGDKQPPAAVSAAHSGWEPPDAGSHATSRPPLP